MHDKRKKKVCGKQQPVYSKEEITNPPTTGFRRRRKRSKKTHPEKPLHVTQPLQFPFCVANWFQITMKTREKSILLRTNELANVLAVDWTAGILSLIHI